MDLICYYYPYLRQWGGSSVSIDLLALSLSAMGGLDGSVSASALFKKLDIGQGTVSFDFLLLGGAPLLYALGLRPGPTLSAIL